MHAAVNLKYVFVCLYYHCVFWILYLCICILYFTWVVHGWRATSRRWWQVRQSDVNLKQEITAPPLTGQQKHTSYLSLTGCGKYSDIQIFSCLDIYSFGWHKLLSLGSNAIPHICHLSVIRCDKYFYIFLYEYSLNWLTISNYSWNKCCQASVKFVTMRYPSYWKYHPNYEIQNPIFQTH